MPTAPSLPSSVRPDFDGIGLGKHLLRSIRAGALATLDRDTGAPFASLVKVATDADGSRLLLMSRLAAHTLNLERTPGHRCFLREPARATHSPTRVGR